MCALFLFCFFFNELHVSLGNWWIMFNLGKQSLKCELPCSVVFMCYWLIQAHSQLKHIPEGLFFVVLPRSASVGSILSCFLFQAISVVHAQKSLQGVELKLHRRPASKLVPISATCVEMVTWGRLEPQISSNASKLWTFHNGHRPPSSAYVRVICSLSKQILQRTELVSEKQ